MNRVSVTRSRTPGRLVGITSLISGSALFLYFRYTKYVPRKKWIIVPGFAIAALVGWLMTRMSPGVGQAELVVPMLLRGLLLLFIVLPVANLAFRIFAIEEFTHGYRLKNIVRQLTLSFASAAIIIVEQAVDRHCISRGWPKRSTRTIRSFRIPRAR